MSLKILALIFIASFSSVLSDPLLRNHFDDAIVDFLENFKENMSTRWPELNIPSLDPFEVGDINLRLEDKGTMIVGSLTNVTINGLSEFVIDSVISNELKLWTKVNLSLPLMDIQGHYDMEGTIGLFIPCFGNGHFMWDNIDTRLFTYLDFGVVDGSYIGVVDLDMEMVVTSNEVYFENLNGGGELGDLINDMINKSGTDFMNMMNKRFLDKISGLLKTRINEIIQNMNNLK